MIQIQTLTTLKKERNPQEHNLLRTNKIKQISRLNFKQIPMSYATKEIEVEGVTDGTDSPTI